MTVQEDSFLKIFIGEFGLEVILALIERFFEVFGFFGYALSSALMTTVMLVRAYHKAYLKPSLVKVISTGMLSWIGLLLLYPGSKQARILVQGTPIETPATFTPTPTITLTPTFTPTPTITLTPTFTPTPTGQFPDWISVYRVCSTAPPSPFQIGSQAWQCMEEGLQVFARPSPKSQVLYVVRNARFNIIGGPECGYKRVWWRIETFDKQVRGWVPETAPGGHPRYLCPIELAP